MEERGCGCLELRLEDGGDDGDDRDYRDDRDGGDDGDNEGFTAHRDAFLDSLGTEHRWLPPSWVLSLENALLCIIVYTDSRT